MTPLSKLSLWTIDGGGIDFVWVRDRFGIVSECLKSGLCSVYGVLIKEMEGFGTLRKKNC